MVLEQLYVNANQILNFHTANKHNTLVFKHSKQGYVLKRFYLTIVFLDGHMPIAFVRLYFNTCLCLRVAYGRHKRY